MGRRRVLRMRGGERKTSTDVPVKIGRKIKVGRASTGGRPKIDREPLYAFLAYYGEDITYSQARQAGLQISERTFNRVKNEFKALSPEEKEKYRKLGKELYETRWETKREFALWINSKTLKSSMEPIQKWINSYISRNPELTKHSRSKIVHMIRWLYRVVWGICPEKPGSKRMIRLVEPFDLMRVWKKVKKTGNYSLLAHKLEEHAMKYLAEFNRLVAEREDFFKNDYAVRSAVRNFCFHVCGVRLTAISGALPSSGVLKHEYFTPREIQQILNVINDIRDPWRRELIKNAVLFALHTATRANGCANAKIGGIQETGGLFEITLKDKGKSGYKTVTKTISVLYLPWFKRWLKILAAYYGKDDWRELPPDTPLFPGLRLTWWRSIMKRIYKKAGVKITKEPLHVWRHTMAMS